MVRSAARVRVGPAVEVGEVLVEVVPAGAGVMDHGVEAATFGFQGRDLSIDSDDGVAEQGASLGVVPGGPQAHPVPFPGGLVLEQLADLGKGEPGVVAQGADEAQALEIRGVEQPIRAIRSGGGLEQADLLVIADRAARQAGCSPLRW